MRLALRSRSIVPAAYQPPRVCRPALAGWHSLLVGVLGACAPAPERRDPATPAAATEAAPEPDAPADAARRERLLVVAGTFGAGACSFDNCREFGWTGRFEGRTFTARCRFNDCLRHGWSVEFADGTRASTACRFNRCMQQGWETRIEKAVARSVCSFGDCLVHGWQTHLPGGTPAQTVCRLNRCLTGGWETVLPDRTSWRCSCRLADCYRGAECRMIEASVE